ncbi:DUF309 domain-containing protein [Staphylococcus simulans]|uniref:DUF309 domain-containing protein n=1 Tax=Staphylococcus simulans TaxID=1286 RepID=UPI000D1DD22F|nr:DUF309 domain-containing protein [Staphylococcus simulans]MDY5060882.1 DUF309 domain-containing protein [Staphylococcus simulans]PTJ15260.1 DUF309 domain-containing protein [Staphylococcus simulans]
MKQALIEFYYQFHTKQHYFLCHDILEDAWKAQAQFTKRDAVVSLILCATGCYHYRRANYKGAHTLFQRAARVAHESQDNLYQLGIESKSYLKLLNDLIENTKLQQPFIPVELPLLSTMKKQIKQHYPDYAIMHQINTLPYICDHHLLRDRHEVEQERLEALKQKQLKHKK